MSVTSAPGGALWAVRLLRAAALLSAVAMVVLVAWVIVARFLHPVEVEWMAGGVRDGVTRVRLGQPLYAAPSASFIAFIYPPLYFWASAALARVAGVTLACKLVSVGSLLVTCGAVYGSARSLGARRAWAALAAVLHLGSFSYTLFFFDVERVDPLEGALATLALLILLQRGRAATLSGGALMALAYFAKQPGLLVFLGAIFGLLLAREWRRAALAAAAGALVFACLGGYLHASTGGWFEYYCFSLPSRHGIEPRLVSTFFIVDMPKAFALSAATVAFGAPVVYRLLRRRDVPWTDVVFASVVGAGAAGAFFLRAHDGGWTNVLLAWTPFGCVAVGVVASRLLDATTSAEVHEGAEIALLGAVVLQLLAWSFDPTELAPGPTDDRNEASLRAFVKKLEERGEVLCTPMGDVTRVRHFHVAALFDVLRAGLPVPPDYLEDLRAQRYAAMVVSVPNETQCPTEGCKAAAIAVMSNYFVAGRIATPRSYARVGFEARATWVMLPRASRLELPLADLAARQNAEAALAEMRFHLGFDVTSPDLPYADLEALAAAEVARSAQAP